MTTGMACRRSVVPWHVDRDDGGDDAAVLGSHAVALPRWRAPGRTPIASLFALSVKSITGILRYGPARFVNFTLGNWIDVVEVLEILSQSGQHLLSNRPSL